MIHFCPYGSYDTTCGLPVFIGMDILTTEYRKATTCPDCTSKFTDD